MKTTLPKLTEKAFQSQVIQLARLLGWKVYHTHDSRHSAKGFPDLCMVRDGVCLMVELKSEKGKITDDQVRWLLDLDAVSGITTFVWRPADWDAIQDILTNG